ncbi:MAG: hypothetical protein O6761_05585 [Thaumarchaeota archaeon]|nr:MAG: hypothetical protein NPMRIOTA_70002 [Nitrosopumilales archaeon]MCZ6582628.1 hypothetical protein [Nitrososphaerota archaeon]GFN40101.1 MAG: conserved hypothetical protein [Marine Group I thaumarchaeote]
MDYPLSTGKDGIKIKPEKMESEKLYHCVYNDKVFLVYKDEQHFLNCYEIEEKELVDMIKLSSTPDEVQKILEDYIKKQNLKH